MIKKAVIPAGGAGTRMNRFYPFPKEMLPVGDMPLILHTVEEAVRSGLKDIIIILHPKKNVIKESAESTFKNVKFTFEYQYEPSGLTSAIVLAEPHTENEDFAVLLPDNLYVAKIPAIKQLIDSNLYDNQNLIGIVKIRRGEERGVNNSGRIEFLTEKNGVFILTGMKKKEKKGYIDCGKKGYAYKSCGRYIFKPEFFAYYRRLRSHYKNREFDDGPVIRKMIEERRMTGIYISGRYLDAGNPDGYEEAKKVFEGSKET